MKTKTFLLICLFLGIATTQLSAQNGKNGTGSVVTKLTNLGWYTDVYCDGVLVDYMEGIGDGQVIDHYKDGVFVRESLVNFCGVGIDWTGETFTFSEQDKNFYSNQLGTWVVMVNTHVHGDKGSLYNISFILSWDGNAWVVNVKNATCTGNVSEKH